MIFRIFICLSVLLCVLILETALLIWVCFSLMYCESYGDDRFIRNTKRAVNKVESTGCMYEGRWYSPGSAVRTREACLQCVCAQGALSCRRRACAPPPEPPPRCHIMHQKGDCCPELRCPDDLKHLELIASARFDDSDIDTPSSIGHACVEGGVVYAAGSAMMGGAACEQCFCLGGARRCVRPACLPPPPGCKVRAAAGACCPQRYYCEHTSSADMPLGGRNSNDCIAPDGKWAYEGERVQAAEAADCMQCFCLRGAVRCQRLACAPALRGCRPLLRHGECCPHQYQCEPRNNGTKAPNLHLQHQNTLVALADEDRSFHTSKSNKRETTIRELTTQKSTSAVTITKEQPVTTVKVKRKTDETITDSNIKSEKSFTATLETIQTTVSNDISTTMITEITINDESTTTEQPEGSVKIIINGTINCTTELSSTSLMLNVSDPDMWIKSEAQPRIPIINSIEVESETYSPNDIITERNSGEFDENETFTINVTSSLRSNTTQSTSLASSTSSPKTVPPLLLGSVNISKVKKDEYDYDYPEPTLPPSLPNLKIIPFVAADAVVDEDISSKESQDYHLLETDDKFPVYYPGKDTKQSFAMRKDDIYNPTQYPVFVSKKVEAIQYPSLTHEEDDVNIAYASITHDAPSPVHEYTVSTSMGSSAKINNNIERKPPTMSTKFEMESPSVNLFSPPIETEGGFIPKGPEIIDEYYSVYQSTSQTPNIPHLTTSMQLEPKDECITSDGRRVPEGESINVACSICSCAWGTLHCAPRPCTTPPGCERRTATASTADLCCGELICERRNVTTLSPFIATQHFAVSLNESKVSTENDKESIAFTQPEITTTTASDLIKNYTTIDQEIVKQDTIKDFGSTNSTQITFTEKPAQITTIKDDEVSHNGNHSAEYDDEEEDEGFSFGSVLQLLLSDTYETTTGTPKRKSTTTTEAPKTTIFSPSTKKFYTAPDNMFIPVTHRYPMPPKKLYPQNTVNRIDHLLLGEPTVIRKTTPRTTTTYKPVITTRKTFTTPKTTSRPITTKTIEITSKDGFQQTADVRPPHNFLTNLSLGLPKLAGCNIYGRMYRVGRIIAELSSPCQECKCTEVGVQCRSLNC